MVAYVPFNNIQAGQLKNLQACSVNHNLTLNVTAGTASGVAVLYDIPLTSLADSGLVLFDVQVYLHSTGMVPSGNVGTYNDGTTSWLVSKDTSTPPNVTFVPSGEADKLIYNIDLRAMFNYLTAQAVTTGNEYFNGFLLGPHPAVGAAGTLTVNSALVTYSPIVPITLTSNEIYVLAPNTYNGELGFTTVSGTASSTANASLYAVHTIAYSPQLSGATITNPPIFPNCIIQGTIDAQGTSGLGGGPYLLYADSPWYFSAPGPGIVTPGYHQRQAANYRQFTIPYSFAVTAQGSSGGYSSIWDCIHDNWGTMAYGAPQIGGDRIYEWDHQIAPAGAAGQLTGFPFLLYSETNVFDGFTFQPGEFYGQYTNLRFLNSQPNNASGSTQTLEYGNALKNLIWYGVLSGNEWIPGTDMGIELISGTASFNMTYGLVTDVNNATLGIVNRLGHSHGAFNTANWTITNCTIVDNNAVDPFGANDASTITPTSGTWSLQQMQPVVAGQFYTASCYVKVGNDLGQTCTLYFCDATKANGVSQTFTLQGRGNAASSGRTGAAPIGAGIAGGPPYYSGGFEPYIKVGGSIANITSAFGTGGGWYRITVAGSVPGTNAGIRLESTVAMQVFGFQLEKQRENSWLSDYIAVIGAALAGPLTVTNPSPGGQHMFGMGLGAGDTIVYSGIASTSYQIRRLGMNTLLRSGTTLSTLDVLCDVDKVQFTDKTIALSAIPVALDAWPIIPVPFVANNIFYTLQAAYNAATSWAITKGDPNHYFQVDSSGNLSLTTAGIAALSPAQWSITPNTTEGVNTSPGTMYRMQFAGNYGIQGAVVITDQVSFTLTFDSTSGAGTLESAWIGADGGGGTFSSSFPIVQFKFGGLTTASIPAGAYTLKSDVLKFAYNTINNNGVPLGGFADILIGFHLTSNSAGTPLVVKLNTGSSAAYGAFWSYSVGDAGSGAFSPVHISGGWTYAITEVDFGLVNSSSLNIIEATASNASGSSTCIVNVGGKDAPARFLQSSANLTLSNLNMTATATTASANGDIALATVREFHKRYCEFTVNALDGVNSWAAGVASEYQSTNAPGETLTNTKIGTLTYTLPGGLSQGLSMAAFADGGTGAIKIGGVTVGNLGASPAVNDVVCIAVDLENKRIWFRLNNGNWNNSASADPALNIGGIGPIPTASKPDALTQNYVLQMLQYTGGNAFDTMPIGPALYLKKTSGAPQGTINGGPNFKYAMPSGYWLWSN